MVSLVCPCYPWLVLAPRVFQLCTNHFVWVVCRPVGVIKACQLSLVPSRNFNPPLYPSKGCELGSVLRLLLFRCFLLGLTFEPFKELGVRHPGLGRLKPFTLGGPRFEGRHQLTKVGPIHLEEDFKLLRGE